MAKAVEGRWSLKDQVTPAIQKINRNTLIYTKTLRDLQIEGRKTWNDLRGLNSIVGIGLVTAFGAGVKAAADFQSQMALVSTILDGNVTQKIQTMSSQVLQLAKDTGTSTSLITDGLYQTISSIGDTKDAFDILTIATKSATASNAKVIDGVNLISLIMKGYGSVNVQTAKQVADLAFQTANLGVTTFPELAASMGEVIPMANTMGIKFNELFGVYATLTGVTGDTAEVSTEFRSILEGLLKPEKKMEDALKKLGFANGQAAIKTLGLSGTLNALKGEVHGSDTALANLFGRVEAKTAVLALTGTQAKSFADKTKAMADSAGAMEQAYNRATDTVANKWKKLVQTVNATVIQGSTSSGLLKDIGNILTGATKTVNFFVNNWSQIKPIIYGVATALIAYKAAAIGGTIWTALFGKESMYAAVKLAFYGAYAAVATGEIGLLTAAQRILNAAFRANPIGFVVTVIGLLVTGVIYAKQHVQELYLIWMKVWNGIVGVSQWAVNKYIDFANIELRAFKFAFDSIKYAGISIWDAIISAAQSGINSVLKLIAPVSGILQKVGIKIPASVDFSGAKMNAVKPVWDASFGIDHVNFSGAEYGQDAIMAQTKKAQAERDSLAAKQIKALDDNTAALSNNTDATNDNTDATAAASGGVAAVDMSAEQIADKLFPRLERHLYGTT